MAAHVLVTVERIAVGDGLIIDCLIYGISSDGAMRNELDGLQDSFTVETDLGTSPLEYYRLIVSTCMAVLNTNLTIDIKEEEVIVLGWDDARFYGTSAYEDVDDFHKSSITDGKFQWNGTRSTGVGTNHSFGGRGPVPTNDRHMGMIILQTGSSSGAYNWFITAIANRVFWIPIIKRMAWIGSAQNTTYFVNRLMGLCNTNNIFLGSSYYLFAQQYNNTGAGATNWGITWKDATGTYTQNTGIVAVNGAENWVEFEIFQLDSVPEGLNYRTTFKMTMRNLFNGYAESYNIDLVMPVNTSLTPQFGLQTLSLASNGNRNMWVDQFRYALSDVNRVLPEY